MENSPIAFEEFEKVHIRVGTLLEIHDFPEGKYSTHQLLIDFGENIGKKKSLARLHPNYQGSDLIGRQIIAVTNFPVKQIGKHLSEVLVLGVPDDAGNVVLLHPERKTPNGGKVF